MPELRVSSWSTIMVAQTWAKCIDRFNESIIELEPRLQAWGELMNSTNELKHGRRALIYIDESIVELKDKPWARLLIS